jgi:DNA-binding FadR family transcriptional regulator
MEHALVKPRKREAKRRRGPQLAEIDSAVNAQNRQLHTLIQPLSEHENVPNKIDYTVHISVLHRNNNVLLILQLRPMRILLRHTLRFGRLARHSQAPRKPRPLPQI